MLKAIFKVLPFKIFRSYLYYNTFIASDYLDMPNVIYLGLYGFVGHIIALIKKYMICMMSMQCRSYSDRTFFVQQTIVETTEYERF
tara:strand:+ start:500 stop:757 length:258 start_codon:yes stop_codon:yes gene_type:complete